MPENAQVIGIGDSLVAGWPVDLLTIPKKFDKYWNFGFPGDTTSNVLWRMAEAPLERVDPTKVFLLVGTNDLNLGRTPCETVFGIEAIVRLIERKWPRASIGVISIPPRGKNNSEFLTERTQVNSALASLSQHGHRFELIGLPDAQLVCTASDGDCTYYQKDYLHLNRRGYAVLNRIVHEFLER
jgi:lysophospholipase L1-like esterase